MYIDVYSNIHKFLFNYHVVLFRLIAFAAQPSLQLMLKKSDFCVWFITKHVFWALVEQSSGSVDIFFCVDS